MSQQQHPGPIVRNGPDERRYLLARADHHRQLAGRSEEQGARAIHQRLCALYEERAEMAIVVHPG